MPPRDQACPNLTVGLGGLRQAARRLRLPPGGGHVVAACRSGLLRGTASAVGAGALRTTGMARWHDRIGSVRPLWWRGRWILATPLWERSLREMTGITRPLDPWLAAVRRRRAHRRTVAGEPPGGQVDGREGAPVPFSGEAPWFVSAPHDADEEPRFPIDVVYTWVDGEDPRWRARFAEALLTSDSAALDGQAVNPARFRNRDELRYSLRSLAAYAKFVRNVYVVTDGQVPSWLDHSVPNLRIVTHDEILEAECLPTFNSHAIETALHRIDGLAEHYLYLNDDFFFGRPCTPSTFFTSDGRAKLFPDPRAIVPAGPPGPNDRPVDSASKNTRDLTFDEFDLRIEHKMQHTPYPQRRSVLAEMEERFPQAFKQTARSPFRHHTDVNIASCLSHYYAFATGAAVPGDIAAAYVNIGNPWAPLQMRRLLRHGDRQVFCLNEGSVSVKRQAIVDATVRAFLKAYFPDESAYELGH